MTSFRASRPKIEKINTDGSLPPGVKLVPFYDRTNAGRRHHRTVLHNLIFGCLLVFFIQWIFLGDLRSAIIVGVNIPFALFFSIIILVLRGEDANLLSVGAVDFGIIVDSAVILVENIYRNFQSPPEVGSNLLQHLAERRLGADPTRCRGRPNSVGPTGCASSSSARCRSTGRCSFPPRSSVAAFVPLFTMQGVEGQIFSPMARTYGYALVGALLATFTVTPCLASLLLPEHVEEVETVVVRGAAPDLHAGAALVAREPQDHAVIGLVFLGRRACSSAAARQRIPAGAGRGQSVDSRDHAADDIAGSRHADRQQDPRDSPRASRSHHRGVAARPARRRQRRGGFFNVEFFVPLKPFDEWPTGITPRTN